MTQPLLLCGGYSAGHPWYYVLDGDIPRLKQIRAYALEREYRGYLAEEIDQAHLKPEPKRSQSLFKIRSNVLHSLRADISRYREVARDLRRLPEACEQAEQTQRCNDVHTSMSLKFCHIMNGFAHLSTLDALPKQLDLFGAD